jgi:hypothetical protein
MSLSTIRSRLARLVGVILPAGFMLTAPPNASAWKWCSECEQEYGECNSEAEGTWWSCMDYCDQNFSGLNWVICANGCDSALGSEHAACDSEYNQCMGTCC